MSSSGWESVFKSVQPCTTLPAIAVSFFLWRHVASRIKSHVDVPAIGPRFPGLAFISGITALFKYDVMIDEGHRKFPNGIFKLPLLTEWAVVATGSFFKETARLPDNKASFRAMIDEQLQLSALLGPEVMERNIHLSGVRQLTRNLDKVFDDIHNEIVLRCKYHFTTKPKRTKKWWRKSSKERVDLETSEWAEQSAQGTFFDLANCLNQRIFVGLPLAHDEAWMGHALNITADLGIRGTIVSSTPSFLRPTLLSIVNLYRGPVEYCSNVLHLEIQQRLSLPEEERPNDMITWLLDQSTNPKEVLGAFHLINFAATATTALTLVQALYHLASHPEYAVTLREEIASVVGDSGWSKKSVDRLDKLDSFIRETQRVAPLAAVSIQRLAVDDFTFSNGVHIPKGTLIHGPVSPIEADPVIYSEPEVFKPFRFVPDASNAEQLRKEMTTIGPDFLPFGYGRNACPGRWYAQLAIKTTMAHLLLNYEVELEKKWDGKCPPDLKFQGATLPNVDAKLRFRCRHKSSTGLV